jgi:hypothetical protein
MDLNNLDFVVLPWNLLFFDSISCRSELVQSTMQKNKGKKQSKWRETKTEISATLTCLVLFRTHKVYSICNFLATIFFFFPFSFFVEKTALLRWAGQQRHNTANNIVLDRNHNLTLLSDTNCKNPSWARKLGEELDKAFSKTLANIITLFVTTDTKIL